MGSVFFCRDTAQEALLTEAATVLQGQGHRIVRGPSNEVGKRRFYTADEAQELLEGIDVAVFTNRHEVTGELLARAPGLKGICYPVTGTESLDLEAASALGVIVGHGRVRGNAIGMAEATIMLVLNLLYGLQESLGLIASDDGWGRPAHRIRSLAGKTIGIVGFGRIAREVAMRLVPFEVDIVTYSPRAKQAELPAHVRKMDLPSLLAASDVVSVLTGLTDETRGMIGAAELALMKSDALLVNTGRGAVVDEPALVEALREKRIAGAGLDAFAAEPLPLDSPLRGLANVILTPHCIGHTEEGIAEFAPALVENVNHILTGSLPLYCLNPEIETQWHARLERIATQHTDRHGAAP